MLVMAPSFQELGRPANLSRFNPSMKAVAVSRSSGLSVTRPMHSFKARGSSSHATSVPDHDATEMLISYPMGGQGIRRIKERQL